MERSKAHNGEMLPKLAKFVPAVALLLALHAPCTAIGSDKSVAAVDINRATVGELMKVPGMTQSWAARIVRFRPYRTKLDLLEQGVVPQGVYQRIRDGVIAHRVTKEESASEKHP
jgi:DNA uptake protein ComE-like DNA-binding protein